MSEPKSHQDLEPKFFYLLNEASKVEVRNVEVAEALFQTFDAQSYSLLLVKPALLQQVNQLKVAPNFHVKPM